MTATTLNPSIAQEAGPRSIRVAIVVLVAAVLLALMFFVGRLTAPTHTVHTVVTVPTASVSQPETCRSGRLC